jgi:hypothetical protein
MILLSKAHAERVRGITTPGHALDPRQIGEDQFILGPQVLDDPAHAKHIPFLSTLPHCDILLQHSDEVDKSDTITIIKNSIVKPPNTPRIYKLKGNAYDRPPFPEKGDWSESALYESIGRALSGWETFERSFAMLFQAFLSPSLYHMPAWRAYGSVVTFRGRADMVAAAAEAYFLESPATAETPRQKSDSNTLIKRAREFSKRRNDIAHGLVGAYSSPSGPVRGLALMPADYSANKQQFRDDLGPKAHLSTKPTYAYTSVEINFFAKEFFALSKPTYQLGQEIHRYFKAT